MDRKGQLGNVSFGGSWSEQIPRREQTANAVAMVAAAVDRTGEEDLRQDVALQEALEYISKTHPKGRDLQRSWRQALNVENPGLRYGELSRIAQAIIAWAPK